MITYVEDVDDYLIEDVLMTSYVEDIQMITYV